MLHASFHRKHYSSTFEIITVFIIRSSRRRTGSLRSESPVVNYKCKIGRPNDPEQIYVCLLTCEFETVAMHFLHKYTRASNSQPSLKFITEWNLLSTLFEWIVPINQNLGYCCRNYVRSLQTLSPSDKLSFVICYWYTYLGLIMADACFIVMETFLCRWGEMRSANL